MKKKFNRLMGEEEEPSYKDECNKFCTLTRKQRLAGFAVTFGVGWIITFMAVLEVTKIRDHGPTRFALLYTIGNVLAILSTMFLWGPINQVKDMFKKNRWIATCIYLGAMGLTLYAALGTKNVGFVLICIIIQFFAMLWYSLSYIPFARKAVKKCLRTCVGM